jgi:hypothetical protein
MTTVLVISCEMVRILHSLDGLLASTIGNILHAHSPVDGRAGGHQRCCTAAGIGTICMPQSLSMDVRVLLAN